MKHYLILIFLITGCKLEKQENDTCGSAVYSDKIIEAECEYPPNGTFNIEKNIIIIVGQSNSCSRAVTDITYTNDRVFILNGGDNWEFATQNLNKYSSIGANLRENYSFGWSFAEKYLESFPEIKFISNAQGSTPSSYFVKGKPGYDEMIRRSTPYKGKIAGVLFHQGESDALSGSCSTWRSNVLKMVKDFRDHMGENVPFIFGELSRDDQRFYGFNKDLPALYEHLDNIKIVSSKNITTKTDKVHFDLNGQKLLGAEYYEAFTKTCGSRGK